MVDYDGGNSNGSRSGSSNNRNEIGEQDVFGSVTCEQSVVVDLGFEDIVPSEDFNESTAEAEARANIEEEVGRASVDISGPAGRGFIVNVSTETAILSGEVIDEILESVRIAVQGNASSGGSAEVREWAVRARRVR